MKSVHLLLTTILVASTSGGPVLAQAASETTTTSAPSSAPTIPALPVNAEDTGTPGEVKLTPQQQAEKAAGDAAKKASEVVDPDAPKVASLRLSLADPEPDELERLEAYLKSVIGKPSGPALVTEVSRRRDLLGRYATPLCRTETLDATRVALNCTIKRARVLRRVRFDTNDAVPTGEEVANGLPLAILQNEVRKRIVLRPGEPIDDDDALGRGRIARQRARIEDFLEREGYYKAQVIIDVSKADEHGEVDIDVHVRGGSWVRVRRVDIASFGPFSQRRLIEAFSRMCLNGEGLIDGVFVGNITSCFNRRRLQATQEAFTRELQALGYPEGRLRVTPTFIDARAANDDEECAISRETLQALTKARLPIPPRCVDLKVEVIAGRHVVSRFHVENASEELTAELNEDGVAAQQPKKHDDVELIVDPPIVGGTWRWLRTTFGEPTSRLWQLTFSAPIESASDTDLSETELRKRLTFNEASSVDETEAKLSEERVLDYLNERGYPAPKSELVYREYNDGNVAIDFYLEPGIPTPLSNVRFVGNRRIGSKQIFKDIEFAATPRSLTNTGFVTPRDLEDDVVRLRRYYGQQGFPEANIEVHATRDPQGDVEVVFVIEEGERFTVEEVVFEGGDPKLSKAVLSVLALCGANTRRGDPPETGKDCKGVPLLADEFDTDARRVEAIYAGNGFPDAEASVQLGFNDKGPTVLVAVFPLGATGEARTNPKVGNVSPLQLGQIFVEGNLRTRRDVLLREMGLDDDDIGSRLNPDQIAKGVSRLRRTGLYSRVDVQLVGVDDGDDTAHVRVSLEERPATTIDLSVGFSTQQFFSLRLEGRDRNLFGTMFDGSAAVDMGLFIGRYSQVRNQIRWPRILGSDFTLTYTPLALSYLDQPSGLILTSPSTGGGQKVLTTWDQPDFRRRLFTASTAIGIEWRAADIAPIIDDKLTLGFSIEARGDWLQIAGRYYEPLSGEALQSVDGLGDLFVGSEAVTPITIIAFTPRVAYSNIDNPFDPLSGFGAEFFVRMVPFATEPYSVVGTQIRSYWSFLEDRVTLATGLRLRAGIVGDSDRCPPSEPSCQWAVMQNDLLRLGGERSVRGVGENQIGEFGTLLDQQLAPAINDDGTTSSAIRPGLFGAVANIELRFTLIRQLFLGDLKPAIFSDIGVSTDDFDFKEASLTDQRYAVSFGAGLRYVLPVGPLAFDVAYSPFDQQASGIPLRYSLTLGYIF